MLKSLQALRAFAAISVVAHHAFGPIKALKGPILSPPIWLIDLGAFGVDIFFVISGFLMTFISKDYFEGNKSVGHFMAQRVIRIWPAYVIVTLLACLELFIRRGSTWPYDLQLHRLGSFLFIPSYDAKGWLQPIIGPGWTLNYEMLFYLCFAFTIWLGRRLALVKVSAIVGALFLLGQLSSHNALHDFLGNPIMFEFLFGAMIGFAAVSGRFAPTHGLVWLGGAIASLVILALLGFGEEERLIYYGLPAVMIFIGVLALETSVRWPGFAIFIGNASYSIYLIHILIVYRIAKIGLFEKVGFGKWSGIVASSAATIIAVAAGLLFFLFVERPLLRLCQRSYNRLLHSNTRPPLVAQ